MIKLALAVAFATTTSLAACGGSSTGPGPATPAAPPVAGAPAMPAAPGGGVQLEPGEMTVFDGAQAALKFHANGSTEIAGGPGGGGATAVTWKPGPTVSPDGTFSMNGEPRLQVGADGSITDLKTHQPLPIAVTGDTITITDGGKKFVLGLGEDGHVTFTGAVGSPDKLPRVEGANTPGKRRTVLVLMALMLGGGGDDAHAQGSAVSAPTP